MPEIYLCEKNFLEGHLLLQEAHIGVPNIAEKVEAPETPLAGVVLEMSGPLYETIKNQEGENVAVIDIHGFLANDVPWWAYGTSYDDVIDGVVEANSDKDVDRIKLDIASPGGEVGKVDEAWAAIYGSKKPIDAVASGMVASGAYYLASAADSISSKSPMNLIGSIGVVVAGYTFTEEFLKRMGVRRIIITSKNAPNKYNPIDTKKGEEEVRNLVDATERRFINRVSTGNGVSEKTVIKTYGGGLVFVSKDTSSSNIQDALDRGMINSVENENIKSRSLEESNEVNSGKKLEQNGKKERIDKMEMTDKEFSDKLEAVRQSVRDDHIAIAEQVTSVLSGGKYPESIIQMGYDAMLGKKSVDSFTGAVCVFDAMLERSKQEDAKLEDKEAPLAPKSSKEKKEEVEGNKEPEIDEKNDTISTEEMDELMDKGEWE